MSTLSTRYVCIYCLCVICLRVSTQYAMAASELLMCSNPQATHVPERYGSLYVCNCSSYDLCCPIVVLTESARCIYSLIMTRGIC